MRILTTLYIIGIICGLVGNLIIRLETTTYIKEKKKQGLVNDVDWTVGVASLIRTIVQILLPIYHYIILLSVLVTPREKLLKSVDDAIKKQDVK